MEQESWKILKSSIRIAWVYWDIVKSITVMYFFLNGPFQEFDCTLTQNL